MKVDLRGRTYGVNTPIPEKKEPEESLGFLAHAEIVLFLSTLLAILAYVWFF